VRHPLAALAAANCILAGSFPASEVALRTIGPFTLTGLRFLIAGGLLAHIALPVLRRLTHPQRLRLLAVSAIGLWGPGSPSRGTRSPARRIWRSAARSS
jgi:drug/metabolite transporter (DMT)-like permease